MFDWLKSLLRKICRLLKKIWDAIRPYLAYIVLAIALLYPVLIPIVAEMTLPAYLSWVPGMLGALADIGWPMVAAVGTGLAAVIDSDAVAGVVDKVGEVAGHVAEVVGDTIGTVVTSTASSIFSSPMVLLALGAGAFFLLASSDDDDDTKKTTVAQPRQPASDRPVGSLSRRTVSQRQDPGYLEA